MTGCPSRLRPPSRPLRVLAARRRVEDRRGSSSVRRRSGSPRSALTDHGVMNGAVELYQAARKAGIKPIVGCEVYFVDDHAAVARAGPADRAQPPDAARGQRRRATATSCSCPRPGSSRASSAASRPSTWQQIARYGDGVIALTGCLASRLCSRIADGRIAEGREHVDQLIGALGRENVYFEVQKNGLALQDRCNEEIVQARARDGAARSSAPATSTTCAARTTTTTRRCCACRPRARSPSRRSASRPTSSTSRTRAEMAQRVRGVAGGARDRRSRSPSAATSSSSSTAS